MADMLIGVAPPFLTEADAREDEPTTLPQDENSTGWSSVQKLIVFGVAVGAVVIYLRSRKQYSRMD